MEDIEIQVKKIPAFTVIKNGSILKNIFLLRKPSTVEEPDEEILLVGRHPHCQITLEHPSISRYHLRIHSNPSSHIISVVDLSSVHGTWVSGMRIEPGVHVILKEGDTVKIGGSSRVYELHWLPLTKDSNVDPHFVPTVCTIKEEETNEEEKHEAYTSDDDLEFSDLSLADKVSDLPLETLEPLTSSVLSYSTSDIGVEDSHPLNGNNDTVSIQAPVVVSETTSATHVSDSSEDELNCLTDDFGNESELLNHKIIKEELFSVPNCSKSSCDDTEVEPFTTVASEAKSETESSDCINKSDDELYWFRDNLSNEFDQISHETMKEDVDLSNAMKKHEDDALTQDIGRSNETDTASESEPENQQNTNNGADAVVLFDGGSDVVRDFEQTKMMDESASMVPYHGVDMGVKFESVDHEIMKKESGFVHLPDVTDMDQEEALTPDILKAKEIHMNPQNGLASTKLFDSLDGKDLEFYTPDKENKNPNAFSGKSLSKKAGSYTVIGEKHIFGLSQKSISTDEGVYGEHKVDPFVNCEVVLASSEKENTSRQVIMEGSCNYNNYPQSVRMAVNSSQIIAKKSWTMVVDTNSLLEDKSMKHLKRLEGIKGTRLFVPKFAVNDLTDLKSQVSFFKRSSKKASLALKWIDECMISTRWWIHMDAAVYSSTTVPQVLEIALHLRKEIPDQKIIILSNNLMLKINAMAQGIMCEAAEEFHESLVNPFSERFMWVGSSARGLTWSCVDDIVRQKCHRFGLNGANEFKGLKLLALCYN